MTRKLATYDRRKLIIDLESTSVDGRLNEKNKEKIHVITETLPKTNGKPLESAKSGKNWKQFFRLEMV